MEIKTNINQIPNYQAPIQAPQGGDNDFKILIDGPLKSHAMLVACSNCKKMVQSNIQTEFNWGNYGVYYFCGTFPWILFNSLRQKDINCYDAVHTCSSCGRGLGRYDAC